ncbi:MAG: ribonuclease P [Candidatus Bathyarchaeota archaeon]|nr:ribonuclease P [Candidatus Bathyarchaeota archaeon]
MPKKRSRQSEAKRLARARIKLLWEQASEIAKTDPEGARQRMQVALKVAQKVRIKVPQEIKRKICRRCGMVLVPGESCRARMRNNRSTHLTVTCIACGNITRYYVR